MNARKVFLFVVAGALILGHWVWDRYERRRIVADLAPGDRQAVFASTIAGFTTLCVERRNEGFGKYCDAQRDFLVLFPECDSSCTRLLAKVEQVPTR